MLNWREAIKQAQQKIDKVLDIRPEDDVTTEDATHSKNSSSSISPKSDSEENHVVSREPVMPPSSYGLMAGDDIQTIVSSDIELLADNVTPDVPPNEGDNTIELANMKDVLRNNKCLKDKLAAEQRKVCELKEQVAKLSAKSSTIEKNFESFKAEASQFSQEAHRARQDAKTSRTKVAELTKELENMEEKLNAKDTKIRGMKNAMEDNLAIVKKYTNSNSNQATNISKLNEDLLEKSKRIQELETVIASLENQRHKEETGAMYLDDMIEQTIQGLRKEIEEYRNTNASLQEELKRKEQEGEIKQQEYEEKLSKAVSASHQTFENDLSMMKSDYDILFNQKNNLEIKDERNTKMLEKCRKNVINSQKELESMKTLIAGMMDHLKRENERLNQEVQRSVQIISTEMQSQMKKKEKKTRSLEVYVQTDVLEVEVVPEKIEERKSSVRFEEPCCCKNIKELKQASNVGDVLKILDEVTFQRDQLETTKRTIDIELKETRRQLDEVLLMHGEKIEELDELRIDNEDLRTMLKEQALSLTSTAAGVL